MPRYFFDVQDGEGPVRDETGIELPGPDHLQKEVSRIISDIAREEIALSSTLHLQVQVRDEANRIVYRGELRYHGGHDHAWQNRGSRSGVFHSCTAER